MKPYLKPACLLALLLACGPLTRIAAAKPKGASSPSATASPGAAGSPTPASKLKQIILIPIGHGARKATVPIFDIHAKLQMYFSIKEAFRTDDGHLAMTDAYLQTYDDKQTPDATIYLTRSVLDLDTSIVTSDVPSTVRRSDFEITGKKMRFNTQTHIGHMTGGVRMIIYNSGEMSASTPSPSPRAPSK